mmetsp:Transcript_31710/g.62764  ORF Transcript_31710/g.62764 Transcript_31710/m.62764 type:complete len:121 (+) Transcript_31710:485-847(+)
MNALKYATVDRVSQDTALTSIQQCMHARQAVNRFGLSHSHSFLFFPFRFRFVLPTFLLTGQRETRLSLPTDPSFPPLRRSFTFSFCLLPFWLVVGACRHMNDCTCMSALRDKTASFASSS